jgi:hypothetical protein
MDRRETRRAEGVEESETRADEDNELSVTGGQLSGEKLGKTIRSSDAPSVASPEETGGHGATLTVIGRQETGSCS